MTPASRPFIDTERAMTELRPEAIAPRRPAAGVRPRRPEGSLLTYYLLLTFLTGPAFPFVALYHCFRFRSRRYEFDDEGVTMRWGILFRREISLTYARIQDIHLTSNVVERWLGLARIQVQTASGNAGAEMTIEGLKDFEAIRDDLYSRMRGVRGGVGAAAPRVAIRHASGDHSGVHAVMGESGAGGAGELAGALHEAAAELRRLREALAGAGIPAGGGRGDA
jgi:putative membrane protein